MSIRPDGRELSAMRPIVMESNVNPYAEGSCRVSFGSTTVLCTASVERDVPRWFSDDTRGWITAEYGMLPRSTHTRNRREASSGKQGGRTLEIQRLIGRALRRAVPLERIPGITVRIDCDVLVADGGTRTAAISGAWVALAEALAWAARDGVLPAEVTPTPVAAVSVGVFQGEPIVDLAYAEDSEADFDCNLVFSATGNLIEVQGTAEQGDISPDDLSSLIAQGQEACRIIFEEQKRALQ